MKKSIKEDRVRLYDRLMLRAAFSSLFWSVISDRRQEGEFTLKSLADKLGKNKSLISRWFSKDAPNWRIDSISDIANALNIDVKITATDRETGVVYTPSGHQNPTSIQYNPKLVASPTGTGGRVSLIVTKKPQGTEVSAAAA